MRSIDGEVFPAAAHGQAVLRTTSQALRASSPSRGASGETVHFAECQGLPSIGEVAMRSIDGEVFPAAAHGQAVLRTTSQALRASSPSRGASGETVHFAECQSLSY